MKERPFTVKELLARPDAPATRARLLGAVEKGEETHVDMVALLVLRARAAAERAAEARA